jgi:hypothetical protein
MARLTHLNAVSQAPTRLDQAAEVKQVYDVWVGLVLQTSTNHTLHFLKVIRKLARDCDCPWFVYIFCMPHE